MKAAYGLDEQNREHREFRRINRSRVGAAGALLSYFPDWAYLRAKSFARQVLRRQS
jgi:hypothetical protein